MSSSRLPIPEGDPPECLVCSSTSTDARLDSIGCTPSGPARVKFGIDVLRDENFKSLAGKRVGLIASPSSVDEHLTPTSHLLRDAKDVKLVAMFGPEHGIYGDEYAGDKVARPQRTPRPASRSTRSTARRASPRREMLRGLDALVFDLQDIGSRSYTNISTMKVAMEACAEQDKEFVVLDRANPLGGDRVEGPRLDEEKYSSFVGIIDVPYVHGMTTGELAQLMRERFVPEVQEAPRREDDRLDARHGVGRHRPRVGPDVAARPARQLRRRRTRRPGSSASCT